jgi:predicted extracellular nuclease
MRLVARALPAGLQASTLLLLACAPGFGVDDIATAGGRAHCEAALAPHDVQGSSARSPLEGVVTEVAGVVTLTATGAEPPGFFMRSLEADADPETSEGLFVAWDGEAPQRGALVRVLGTVSEYAERTQLGQIERLEQCGTAPLQPELLDPRALPPDEPWESAWVRARAEWTVVDTSDVLRTGRVTLSPLGRVFASGHPLGPMLTASPSETPPKPAPVETWTLEASDMDATSGSSDAGESERRRALRAGATPRLGAQLDELEAIVQLDGQKRRLLVGAPPPWPDDVPPPPPRASPGRVRLVALNLDNYFLDPAGLGAHSELERSRQRAKLAAALLALDADLLALTELGNGAAAGTSGADSLGDLLAGLDAQLEVERRYSFSRTEAPAGDTLRAGIAYRSARVRARGEARFDTSPGYRRPPLFQSFEHAGSLFTLGVVHFKSKRCGETPVLVPDEGCGDAQRVAEAELLAASVGALAATPAEPVVVLGDFNADTLEPPLVALQQNGFVDLLGAVAASERYSYVFEGRASLLDHALSAPRHPAPPHEVAIWHINADEPAFRDYSLGNPPGEYRVDPRRCSDHDPVILDLEL